MFRNIELVLGYNIMTIGHELWLQWKETEKNMKKRAKYVFFHHFSGGVFCKLSVAKAVKQYRGGPPDKNFQKMRFGKTCPTLTTILLREKTQLSKVVSLLKRFGHPM